MAHHQQKPHSLEVGFLLLTTMDWGFASRAERRRQASGLRPSCQEATEKPGRTHRSGGSLWLRSGLPVSKDRLFHQNTQPVIEAQVFLLRKIGFSLVCVQQQIANLG